ncbi:MAG: NADH-quinone oxidoreductase subunit I [Candidatus Kapabacteria bacterium]|nr:NADH-quinone oxidoreductase subunit I [Candidatus Kapabacteria bacterium]
MSSENKEKQSERLSFWEKLYLPEIARGLGITFKQMFKPSFTRQYPEERWEPTGSYRGRPVLVMEESGERCVACGLCSRVCPALAIEVQAAETEKEKERYPIKFEINMIRCIYCAYCEEVCPEEAIVMSKDYDIIFTDPQEAVLGKEKLLVPIEKLQDRLEFLRQYK